MTEKTALMLDQRERDTIIAGLRFWQRYGLTDTECDEFELAENGREGYDAALSGDEIDALIENRVNICARTRSRSSRCTGRPERSPCSWRPKTSIAR